MAILLLSREYHLFHPVVAGLWGALWASAAEGWKPFSWRSKSDAVSKPIDVTFDQWWFLAKIGGY